MTRHDAAASNSASRVDRSATGDASLEIGSERNLGPLEPLALRARDAARLLGISERSLWSLTKCGDVPHVRIGRTVTYPVEALRAWLKKRSKGGR